MFVKIFASITKSSIWDADPETRIVWITVLLMADFNGNFTATRTGIAREANLPYDRVSAALDALLAPDTESTSADDDGRRLVYCGNNAWSVVNYGKYRELAKAETIREQTRIRVQTHRKRNAPVTQRNKNVTPTEEDLEVLDHPLNPPKGAATAKDIQGTGQKPKRPRKADAVTLNRETLTLDGITDARIAAWADAHPGVDVADELHAITTWIGDNAAKALKVKRWSSFIQNWLQKALADNVTGGRRGRGSGNLIPATPPKPPSVPDAAVALTPPSVDWGEVREMVRKREGTDNSDKWLRGLFYVGDSCTYSGVVTAHLTADDEYTANYVRHNLGDTIAEAMTLCAGRQMRVVVRARSTST